MNGEEEQARTRLTYKVIVTETPKFDLPSYIANYRGRTVFRRLYLIASCSKVLAEEAARLAVQESKKGSDVHNYEDALFLLSQLRSDPSDVADSAWLAQQEKRNAAETKRIENELKQYRNNLIRESIRMGNEDLGSHYHAIGELPKAIQAYGGMREYCTTPAQMSTTALRIIAVAIEQKNWMLVQSQTTKIKTLQMKAEESIRYLPKIQAASGLQYMSQGDYRQAAEAFVATDPLLADTYNEIISSNDVAVYGGLCALASMTRSELQEKVLNNDKFRSFLELEPHIRRAINHFCASKYSQCLEILESYRADYLLDIYLQDQIPLLYHRIRTKSIVQYMQPFSRVTLARMEQMFGAQNGGIIDPPSTSSQYSGITITPFVNELIQMVDSSQLSARIDLEKGVLIAHNDHARAAMQQNALDTVDAFIREARIKLLRLNAVQNDLTVKGDNTGPGSKRGRGNVMDVQSMLDTGMTGNQNGHFRAAGHTL